MPVYEFECKSCHEPFELHRSVEERNKTAKCPKCKKGSGKRVYSAPQIIIESAQMAAGKRIGVSKKRLEQTRELKDLRAKRKKDPQSEHDIVSNELHHAGTRKKIART